jgi:hypothetical protein
VVGVIGRHSVVDETDGLVALVLSELQELGAGGRASGHAGTRGGQTQATGTAGDEERAEGLAAVHGAHRALVATWVAGPQPRLPYFTEPSPAR